MKSRPTLTQDQIKDLNQRLLSFRQHGLLPAADAFQAFGKIITSSERLKNPTLCINLVERDKTTYDILCQSLVKHQTHGFINMALERHNFLECGDHKRLNDAAMERLYCSFIFIIDPLGVNKVGMKKELNQGISEYMCLGSIDKSYIQAMLVPAGLEKMISAHFPEVLIYSAPLKSGNLMLSSFTRAAAICSKQQDTVIKDIVIPDYQAALNEFLAEHPYCMQFVTHLSRFATIDDLKRPFKELSTQEKDELQKSISMRMLKSMMTEGVLLTEDLCEFKPFEFTKTCNSTGMGLVSKLALHSFLNNHVNLPKQSKEIKSQIDSFKNSLR